MNCSMPLSSRPSRPARRAGTFALYILFAALSASSNARAEDVEPKARQLFDAGVVAANAGAWERAREHFRQSYALAPRNSTLLNLAGAESHSGHLVEAGAHYRSVLEGAENLAPDVRAAAEVAMADVSRRIAHCTIQVEHVRPGDTATFDEKPISFATMSGTFLADPGPHSIAIQRDGQPIARRMLALAEAERRTFVIRLPAAAADKGARTGGWYRSPWLWTAVGVVIVGSATLGVCAAAGCFRASEPSITPL